MENAFESQVTISRGRGISIGRSRSSRIIGPRDGKEELDQKRRSNQNPYSSRGGSSRIM